MAARAFVIFASDRHWRILSAGVRVEIPIDEETPAQIAAAVAAALKQHGYTGQSTLLAIASEWCLAAGISMDDLPRGDRSALVYRLEEKLPIAAESFTADFVVTEHAALGVCAENAKVAPLVEALEAAGAVIQSIVPAALLALQAMPGDGIVLWGEGNIVNVFEMHNRAPREWTIAHSPAELQLAIPRPDAPIVAHAVPAGWIDTDNADARDLHETATATAAKVLAGNPPWIELRRDSLGIRDALRVHRTPLNAMLGALAAMLLIAAGALLYRGWKYDQSARDDETVLRDEFKREFPGWEVPQNVARIVEAEKRKVMGGPATSLPPEVAESALRLMHAVLGKLPDKPPFIVEKMTFNDTSFEMEGRGQTNESADALVTAARAAGLDVPPPQMRKLPDGAWAFVVRGSKPVNPAVAGGAR